jgi:hypothetical protein
MLSLSKVSTAHKNKSSGHLLQDYYFASQGFEAYFTKKTGFATKFFTH